MKTELVKQLRLDEGVKKCAYKDSLGLLTIGVGRMVDSSVPGGGLRDDEISYMLNNDIDDRIDGLTRALPWFQNLDDVRKAVLVNMSFMGLSKLLAFTKTLDLIRHGQYDQAADEMLDSLWAKQVGDRAKRLSDQMRTGQWVYAQ